MYEGKKDRYPVLSKQVLNELRAYFTKYRPKVYLFNGRKKGQKISEGAKSHAIRDARKRSGIDREINMHVPRLTTRQFILLTTGKDLYQCPCCNKGEMVIVCILPAIRGSPISSMYILNEKQLRPIQLFILFTIFVKKLHRY